MASQPLFDITGADFDRPRYDPAAIEAIIPHRGAMRLLDGIVHESPDRLDYAAFHDVPRDGFWVAGHIPGRPIFPGVLQIEAGAQLACFVCMSKLPQIRFMGFAGIDDVKFRGQVLPGDRLVVLCHELELRPRRSVCAAQGWVHDKLVFEATITGMPL